MEKSLDLVPPAAAARIRGISRRTIWNWLYRGWIQRFTDTGSTLVDLAEVKAFVAPKAGPVLGSKLKRARNAPLRVVVTPSGVTD